MTIHLAFADGIGVYGNFFHYALVIFLVGSAMLVFFYLWKRGLLNMDEDPKFQMMREDPTEGGQTRGSTEKHPS